jgi:hypothetical protein
MDHMNFVNRLRNENSAHSSVDVIDVREPAVSRSQLEKEHKEILEGFLHMLSHLEALEEKMGADLREKATAINQLKRNGLKPEQCNFNLSPGKPFEFTMPEVNSKS